MKKIISLILTLCLVLGLTAGPAYASTTSTLSSAQQTVQALGIMVGDGSGNMNLSGNITRAQFAKMMIAASAYKDTISTNSKSSPFKDVKYTHWAASYVQAAVTAGWVTGYTDGTYRPDKDVTLEEAVSAVLKMLGYTSSDFAGSFPEAQLAKYVALGLNANISKTQGQVLTRQDCMYLFYNLLSTKTKSGSYYAATLGYTVNSSGELDYSSLVLKNMKGPFIVEASTWSSALPFTAATAAVYKNGSLSTLSAVTTYDVYYYNAGMQTVWVYSNNVTGVYTAASPSTSSPTSVTVAGKTYSISTSTAAFELSDMGSFGIGDTVTLLLGMNGDVVGVVSAATAYSTKYGLVVSTGTNTYTNSSGSSVTTDIITVACTDGNTYEYEVGSNYLVEGNLIKISYANGKITVSQVDSNTLSGTVNSSAITLGSYAFSADVQILDVTKNGSFIKIYPERLAGLTLGSNNVKYFVLDSDGKISHLILSDVTGDAYSYGVVTSVPAQSISLSASGTYKYMVNGTSGSCVSSSIFSVQTGPAQIEFDGNSIVSMKSLSGVLLTSLNSLYAQSNDTQYTIGNNVSVYICKNSTYYLSSISAVSSASGYTLYGYYDQSTSSGGRLRVIIANAN